MKTLEFISLMGDLGEALDYNDYQNWVEAFQPFIN
jgi:hypothetical protein